MIQLEYMEGRYTKKKEINFHTAIESIKRVLNNKLISTKTIVEIPSENGVGMHNTSKWDIENISIDIFDNNLVIDDGANSISINKKVNMFIMDRHSCYTISFQDYYIQLEIRY
ncbi:MAG: hypothetical protein LIR50_19725 [Bacillota bacterium]|nr:hypothetical protein [Bacillota bacterium]